MQTSLLRLACFSALLLPAPALAGTEEDEQAWLRASASGTLKGPWQISLDSVLRFGNDAQGLYEGEFGGSVGYQLREQVTLFAGYLYVPSFEDGETVRTEHRFRQQLNFPVGDVAHGRLSGRLRVEQRLVGGSLGVRLRPTLNWSRPFRAGRKTALVLSHESFVNLNGTRWGQRGGYDRMRNFVGVSTPLGERVSAEIGYLNQYSFRSGTRDSQDHVASLALSFSF